MSRIANVLTIAGIDPSGGAGVFADLKAFSALGAYGCGVVAALTAQNTRAVTGVHTPPAEFLRLQIDTLFADVRIDAVKIGMLASADIVATVADRLAHFGARNLVVDPVMVAKSGDPLLAEDARQAIRDELLPLATVITPNVFEAEALLGRRIEDLDAMRDAAHELMKFGCRWVVIKGGSLDIESRAVDVVCDGGEPILLTSPRFESRNTQGTGCTFASAIAAGLAKGGAPLEAIKRAKEYVTDAIRSGPPIGSGHGPPNHLTGVHSKW